ncbi:MAG: fumarate hydratase [Spirochaetota bacterium]
MNTDAIYAAVTEEVERRLKKAAVKLPADVEQALRGAAGTSHPGSPGQSVLSHILQNLEAADRSQLPMCQDTGMVLAFLDLGRDSRLTFDLIKDAVEEGAKQASVHGYFRKSIVADPLFKRENTGTNLPIQTYLRLRPGAGCDISLMLKGFGSENCSALTMLNPTVGREGVLHAVGEAVQKAGGKPCPPIVVGVGVGGSSDTAMLLSKRALLREVGSPHPDPAYRQLEQDMLEQINRLDIGPGGLGGTPTALGVMIEQAPTHIAGLPVGVSISCWADRKARISIDESGGIR